MKINLLLKQLLLPAVAVLLSACQSDYTEEALEKAREYTLDNTRMLPEVSRNYIRYATPKLEIGPVFPHFPMMLTEYAHLQRNVDFNPRRDSSLDAILAQFVWNPPELGYSVIVIGQCRRDLSYWEPVKVMLKNIVPVRKEYERALRAAVSYVTNNMLYLTRLERVRVRTSEAEVRETDFDLEYMFEEQLESSAGEWKSFLETLKEHRDRRQFSLVWKADDPAKRIVIAGFGTISGFERWSPLCGMVIPASQLDEYTLETYQKGPDEPVSPENQKP